MYPRCEVFGERGTDIAGIVISVRIEAGRAVIQLSVMAW